MTDPAPDHHLALFDFDGTITDRDTMLAFVRHAHGPLRTLIGLVWLSPMLVAYQLKWIPNDRAKVILLRHFFAGCDRAQLAAWAESFADAIDGWVRPAARERLDWHREQDHEVVVVSASLDLWLTPWMQRQQLRLLCTRAEYAGDTFTGALDGPNCHGPEKVTRVRDALDLDGFTRVYAYGDSSGDTEMLAVADEPSYKPFR